MRLNFCMVVAKERDTGKSIAGSSSSIYVPLQPHVEWLSFVRLHHSNSPPPSAITSLI